MLGGVRDGWSTEEEEKQVDVFQKKNTQGAPKVGVKSPAGSHWQRRMSVGGGFVIRGRFPGNGHALIRRESKKEKKPSLA